MNTTNPMLTKTDFETDQEVRWCPGCGDYSILNAIKNTLPTLGMPIENFVFISGIGCSSRFPYYLNTYGFHTIHGRAAAIATGVKLANPKLSVWVITGDGDGLSIGGNHLIHLLRRNIDINVLLFNNRIYGLTKGQYSPTSELGKKTKSSPQGTAELPFNPLTLALGAGATFVARSLAVDTSMLSELITAAYHHKGTSFIEIYQNCNIFNNGAYSKLENRETKEDSILSLQNKMPMVYGAQKNKGVSLDKLELKTVKFDPSVNSPSDVGIMTYDSSNKALAQLVVELSPDIYPTPMGIIYQNERPCFEELLATKQAINNRDNEATPEARLNKLFRSGDTWEV